MTPPKYFYVQFCASNTTHIKMWNSIIFALRQKKHQVKMEILSLDAYYGQTPFALIKNSNADNFYVLERNWSILTYWAASGVKRLLLIVEAAVRLNLRLRHIRPDLIVLGNDIGIVETLIIKIASGLKIPTILVQDGILNGNLRREDMGMGNRTTKIKNIIYNAFGIRRNHIYGHGDSTAFAVMGEYTYNLLQSEGKNMGGVFITGQPRFDDYANTIRKGGGNVISAEVRRKYKIPDETFLIVFFTQPLITYGLMKPDLWDYVMETVFLSVNEVMENNDCRLIIKLHPAESLTDFVSRYSRFIDAFADRIILDEKADLQEVLQVADVVIVYSSTVSLEAILFDKPVIMFDPYEFIDYYKFVDMGAVVHSATKDDLIKNLLSFKETSDSNLEMSVARAKAVKFHLWNSDGLASSRVADLILKYLTK